jgi:uncharacterized membrane protein HdeD (DUF308 family)
MNPKIYRDITAIVAIIVGVFFIVDPAIVAYLLGIVFIAYGLMELVRRVTE